jgi:hypothetical protein
MLAVGKPSLRPSLAPLWTRPCQVVADAGRGIGLAGRALDPAHDADPEAFAPAQAFEQGRVAAALVAEKEVVADQDVTRMQTLDQDLAHEVLGAQCGERLVERQHEDVVNAECLEQAQLQAERGELERRVVGAEEATRVRLEGEHAQAGL